MGLINEDINVQNIVVTEQLNNPIDVNALGKFEKKGFKYNKEKFPGVFFHDSIDKKITFIIFKTGKIVCTGAKSMRAVNSALTRLIKILNKLGFKVKQKKELKIRNLVVTSYIKKIPRMFELAAMLDNIEYNPEVFPGIIYREKNKEYSAAILIFKTGRIVCAGIKNIDIAKRAISDFQKKIILNKNKDTNSQSLASQDFF
ncbi:MAG: hypothetical protein COW47_01235 [Candidatus Huberarchaeum crystalense]|uniref:Uncharacterized protein n=1 Tax=Huberarchaeum crystalense TaxID=2014257 RepID=A0A2G9LIR9_HUBC1|nr:hypothetical protein [archaeon]OIP20839.1 MAG: hypothetical protein AUJ91_00115 [archaeon CG2_30_31_98]PIN66414.1 MAG: hypothetical protein COW69_02460 [Candidatus Huberarchaeum crystalense]NCS98214.1 hypothetical protein [archaeon]PIV13560.1 MAG: hypothetical protein COS45_02310 [Candidatus Huberarchaeum crystalense]